MHVFMVTVTGIANNLHSIITGWARVHHHGSRDG